MITKNGWIVVFCLVVGTLASAAPQTQLSRTEYADRLHGMWLAESIANWTGIRTEGQRRAPPFFTQKDWNTTFDDDGEPIKIEFVFQDPWLSDDDTDIEYLYLNLLREHQTVLLTPQQIADGWDKYIVDEEYVWVSNLFALRHIRKGVLPPVTGMGAINTLPDPTQWEDKKVPIPNFLMIDAQLTTEMFGAIAPGMPEYALQIADLPIRTTSASYGTHAAQHFMLMYSLAAVVDPHLSDREKVLWLAREGRKYLPNTSKTAGIFDFLLAKFLKDCPTVDAAGCAKWESARDAIYDRYHKNAKANGFHYYRWFESSVNYATGIMALLWGQGDLKRTIQIGTLSGWDSDNGTATMGGLLGLLNGYNWVLAQFPGVKLSDRYNIYRTRSRKLPDYLPQDKKAEDTFTMIADRMLDLVDLAVINGGGQLKGSFYQLPALRGGRVADLTPTQKLFVSSANNRVRSQGGTVKATSSTKDTGSQVFADGAESDFSGVEPVIPTEYVGNGDEITFSVVYDREVALKKLRFIEGNHQGNKGQFVAITPEILIGSNWEALPFGSQPSAPLTSAPYQLIDWELPSAVQVRGVRIKGETKKGSASIVELDALSE